MSVKIFEIGGCVRDEILGVPSKDIDYTCVTDSFEEMVAFIEDNGLKIVVSTPEYSTVRAVAPKSGFHGHSGGLDFVWAREDGPYSDGRRPDWTKPATLFADQGRRDFTMNAVAKDPETGEYIDPFGGIEDIKNKNIRCVGRAIDRLREDALRAMRAVRFSVTKDFSIDPTLKPFLNSRIVADALKENISDERIQVELSKMFRYDTVRSIATLYEYPSLMGAAFHGTVSLDATMKTKGRGK